MATSKAADRGEGKSLSYIVLVSSEKGFLIQGPPVWLTQTKKECVNISKVYYSHLTYQNQVQEFLFCYLLHLMPMYESFYMLTRKRKIEFSNGKWSKEKINVYDYPQTEEMILKSKKEKRGRYYMDGYYYLVQYCEYRLWIFILCTTYVYTLRPTSNQMSNFNFQHFLCNEFPTFFRNAIN